VLKTGSAQSSIDVSALTEGIYLLQLQNGGQATVQKLVIE